MEGRSEELDYTILDNGQYDYTILVCGKYELLIEPQKKTAFAYVIPKSKQKTETPEMEQRILKDLLVFAAEHMTNGKYADFQLSLSHTVQVVDPKSQQFDSSVYAPLVDHPAFKKVQVSTDVQAKAFAQSKILKNLEIMDTSQDIPHDKALALEDSTWDALKNNSSITSLTLTAVDISSYGIAALIQAKHLKKLTLWGCFADAETVKTLALVKINSVATGWNIWFNWEDVEVSFISEKRLPRLISEKRWHIIRANTYSTIQDTAHPRFKFSASAPQTENTSVDAPDLTLKNPL